MNKLIFMFVAVCGAWVFAGCASLARVDVGTSANQELKRDNSSSKCAPMARRVPDGGRFGDVLYWNGAAWTVLSAPTSDGYWTPVIHIHGTTNEMQWVCL